MEPAHADDEGEVHHEEEEEEDGDGGEREAVVVDERHELRAVGGTVVKKGRGSKGEGEGSLLRVDKDSAGVVSVEPLMPVNFVPLVGSDG